MRTSLTDIKQAEAWLQGTLTPQDSLLFEARILTNPLLRANVALQKKVLALLRFYHRKKLKEELEAVHQRLFSDPAKADFQQQIHHLFTPGQS